MERKKKKLMLEFPINSTISSLFAKLSTEGGLESWFADKVVQNNKTFTFFWHKTPQIAVLLDQKDNKSVRFRWDDEDDEDDSYFEFRISLLELTGDLTLCVTDFVESDDYDDALQMWNNNIKLLKRTLGAGN